MPCGATPLERRISRNNQLLSVLNFGEAERDDKKGTGRSKTIPKIKQIKEKPWTPYAVLDDNDVNIIEEERNVRVALEMVVTRKLVRFDVCAQG